MVAFVLANKIALNVDGSSSVMLTGGRNVGKAASVARSKLGCGVVRKASSTSIITESSVV